MCLELGCPEGGVTDSLKVCCLPAPSSVNCPLVIKPPFLLNLKVRKISWEEMVSCILVLRSLATSCFLGSGGAVPWGGLPGPGALGRVQGFQQDGCRLLVALLGIRGVGHCFRPWRRD